MVDSQNFNERNKLKPIISIGQLVSSYLVAKGVKHIRDEREAELQNKAILLMPKINSKSQRHIELYDRFSQLVDFKEGLLLIAKKCFDDLDRFDFDMDPSVVMSASIDTAHLRKEYNTSFAKFEKITLEDHTLRVFEKGLSVAENKGGRAIKYAIPLLGCLLHDFGKSSKIREILLDEVSGEAYRAHATVSKMYIDEMLKEEFPESEKTLELLSLIVENHHSSQKKILNDEGVRFIIEADKAARKEEARRKK